LSLEFKMKHKISLLILGLLAIKLIFQPCEFTGDSYGYACEIIKGDWISGHHLLHKYFIGFVWKVAQFLGIFADPLQVGFWLNAGFGALSLTILNNILNLKNFSVHSRFYWVLFVASCFVFVRYSSENETYIFPIFFTLLGWYQQLQKKAWFALLFYLIAVGFHQSYLIVCIPLIWNPAICLQTKTSNKTLDLSSFFEPHGYNFNGLMRTSVFVLLVFGGYLFAAYVYDRTLINLFLQDVQSGLVQTTPNIKNLVFGSINSVRIFIQIHGELQYQIANTWPIWVGVIGIISYIVYVIHQLKQPFQTETHVESNSFIDSNSLPNSWVSVGAVLSLIFTWLFAIYSVGNLEFMVFIPFLLVLIDSEFSRPNILLLNTHKRLNQSPKSFQKIQPIFTIQRLSIFLFIWNFSVYTLPHSIYSTQNLNGLIHKIKLLTIQTTESLTPAEQNQQPNNRTIYFITPLAALFENYSEFVYLTDTLNLSNKIRHHQPQFFHSNEELIQHLKQFNHPPKQNVKYCIISDNRGTERSNFGQLLPTNSELSSPENTKKNPKSWVEYEFSEIQQLHIP
jgi:hypothetical protein